MAFNTIESKKLLAPSENDSLVVNGSNVQTENLDDEEYKENKTLAEKITWRGLYTFASLIALYFFMVAIKFIGDGFTLALGCDTKGPFDFANNPVAGLMIGTVATALLHSSGTVTSIVVALVGSGGMTIRQGVYVIMGANVGTCVTCIMVAFGQVGDRTRFQRAMAAATVHDMYNLWSVFVLFPLEVIFHPLEKISVAMSNAKTSSGAFNSPVDTIVNPVTQTLISVDKKAIYKVATGEAHWRRRRRHRILHPRLRAAHAGENAREGVHGSHEKAHFQTAQLQRIHQHLRRHAHHVRRALLDCRDFHAHSDGRSGRRHAGASVPVGDRSEFGHDRYGVVGFAGDWQG
ncbi:unnamed protein product [Phytophthora lilii]|uniref:Unnamed protein product n=1 Tax=Phytophthora lilii TaxID=2077276 RepID=A0A9W6XHY0_9STRA|nr:unnamed protein product [Phytophthora lilii]